MADIVNMPKLGFDMAEGTLVRWVVNEGEKIEKGAVLAEIETDKATVEVESNFSGVLLRQLVEQGTVVPINDPIAVIGEQGEKVNLEALKKRNRCKNLLKKNLPKFFLPYLSPRLRIIPNCLMECAPHPWPVRWLLI
jgi:pyruvate/2-oxoglutarate dehydrogenase complex dihydrolipoamide acyltransferase (E2) component